MNHRRAPVARLLLAAALLAQAGAVRAAPPAVSKSFSPAVITVNGTSRLTITLTAADATAVTGIGFTDSYPAGLVNRAAPNVSNTCGGTVTAAAGGASLALSGGTIPGGGSCAVSVDVTSASAGSYSNSTGPVTSDAGTATAAGAVLTVSSTRVSNCTCGFQDGQFTLGTVSIDGASDANGSLTGWSSFTGDTDNNTCDAVSLASGTEQGGADGVADAPQNVGRDITWFSFTWDATNIYFYTERLGSSSNIQRFLYYADLNNDGLMNQGERVIEAEWQGSNRSVSIYRHSYNAVSAGGDSLVDAAGLSDGYTMPGTLTFIDANNSPLYTGFFGSTSGLEFEFRVAWADLGLAGPAPVRFHVSALNSSITGSSPPGNVQDNLGGCGGGSGSSQFAAIDLTPPRTVTGEHGTLQCAAHTVTNAGNGDDIFNLTASALPVQASALALYYDTDGDGLLGGSDTLMTDSAGDADATVDTGTLAAGASRDILACYTIGDDGNRYSPSGSGTVTLTATSTYEPQVAASLIDTVTVLLVPDPLVVKASAAFWDPVNADVNPKRIPGGLVTYSVTVTNVGGGTIDADTFFLLDPVPAGLDLVVADFGAPGSGPVEQIAGTPDCGLTYTFGALASGTDDLAFSNDGGASFTYAPAADANGADAAVTHVRINPKGIFAGASAAGTPACTWQLRMRVE